MRDERLRKALRKLIREWRAEAQRNGGPFADSHDYEYARGLRLCRLDLARVLRADTQEGDHA